MEPNNTQESPREELSVFSAPVKPVPVRDLPKRKPKRVRRIVLFCTAAVLTALGLCLWTQRDVIVLLLHPERMTAQAWDSAQAAAGSLETGGKIIDLRMESQAGGQNRLSFRSADKSVSVEALYADGVLVSMTGKVIIEQVSAQTVSEGKKLAQDLLSPFLDSTNIKAMLTRYLPDIAAGAGTDYIDIELHIMSDFRLVITGSPYDIVEFSLLGR